MNLSLRKRRVKNLNSLPKTVKPTSDYTKCLLPKIVLWPWREKTGAGLIDCKRALGESNGDMDEAISILRKKGWLRLQKNLVVVLVRELLHKP